MGTPQQNDTFVARSERVVRAYIQSVLLVDDKWPERSGPLADPEEAYFSEEDVASALDVSKEEPAPSRKTVDAAADEADNHVLLAIEQTVLGEGVLFSAVRYQGQDDRERVVRLARRADILILDWHLIKGDAGSEAKALLKEVGNKGLRFVCIFTGDGRVEDVRNGVSEVLGAKPSEPEGVADFRIGNVIVTIRNKEMVSGSGVSGKELYEAAVTAIAKVYSGFVQLGLLELVQRHRDELPRMLEQFDRNVDAAFAFEASDKDSPVEPGGPFVQLVLDEWRALLEETMADSPMAVMSSDGFSAFLAARAESAGRVTMDHFQEHFVRASAAWTGTTTLNVAGALPNWFKAPAAMKNLADWLGSGMQTNTPGDWKKEERVLAKWAFLRCVLGPASLTTENPFVPLWELEALFQEQSRLHEHLTQGTILRCPDESYLVCVTPLCDAARPEKKIRNVFAFVQAQRVSVPAKPFFEFYGCAIHDGEEAVCLHVDIKPVVSLIVSDSSITKGRPVTARPWMPGVAVAVTSQLDPEQQDPSASNKLREPSPEQNGLSKALSAFEARAASHRDQQEQSISLIPVSQLRPQHALALAGLVSAQTSRVGVDRVEFVRSNFRS